MNKDRAKIFSSFNPLSTLEKALKVQEREKSEKLDLDESKIEENLNQISKLKPADKVRITYHDEQGYARYVPSGRVGLLFGTDSRSTCYKHPS